MSAGAVTEEGLLQVLCLAESCDPAALELTPAQGFLFSRIDGQTPWRLLREIGGLAPDEVDHCLQGWLASGLIEVKGAASSSASKTSGKRASAAKKPACDARRAGSEGSRRTGSDSRTSASKQMQAGPAAAPPSAKPQIDESRIDASLDLDESVQRRILEFEAGLDRTYHEILGVSMEATTKDLKRAYFRLSKDFHPDRYFRRNIGPYAQCLDRIFKKVLEAHELLSDPATRAEIEKTMPPPRVEVVAEPASDEQDASGGQKAAKPRKPRPLTPLERLKQRMPFKISEAMIAERRNKAAVFYQSAQVSARGGRYLEAASSARLAIVFDPSRAEYKSTLTEIQLKAAESRIAELLQRDDRGMDAEEQREAFKLYEEALMYRPHDPVVNDRAAQLAVSLGMLDKAMEYAERAVAHSPEEGAYHRTLGRVFHAQGDRGHAVRELELALEYDGTDGEARKLLTALTRRSRRNGIR